MADVATLAQAAAGTDVTGIANILANPPHWAGCVPGVTESMLLDGVNDPSKLQNKDGLKGALKALSKVEQGTFVVTMLVEAARVNDEVLDWCAGAFNPDAEGTIKSFVTFINMCKKESCGADKAAWLIAALVARDPSFRTHILKDQFVGILLSNQLSDAGKVDALSNVMRVQDQSEKCWKRYVAPIVENVRPTSSPTFLYKSCFCIWLMSFNPVVEDGPWVMKLLKEVLVSCRMEKTVRVSLMALANFLKCKALKKDVVEADALAALTALEYEKWRDKDVYDEIKNVKTLVEAETKNYTNLDRYMAELNTGKLAWGYIHSETFWKENINKFDKDDFAAVKMLCHLVASSTDPVTLSVACHDIGEFARLYPTGKVVCNRYGAKAVVMDKMASPNRDVAREALLCVQKLMLNKWANVEA